MCAFEGRVRAGKSLGNAKVLLLRFFRKSVQLQNLATLESCKYRHCLKRAPVQSTDLNNCMAISSTGKSNACFYDDDSKLLPRGFPLNSTCRRFLPEILRIGSLHTCHYTIRDSHHKKHRIKDSMRKELYVSHKKDIA